MHVIAVIVLFYTILLPIIIVYYWPPGIIFILAAAFPILGLLGVKKGNRTMILTFAIFMAVVLVLNFIAFIQACVFGEYGGIMFTLGSVFL